MCAADRSFTGFGEAEVADFSLAHEVGHRADHVLDGDRGIHAVLIEEVDVVRAQPAQRAFDSLADVCRPAVRSSDRARVIELEPELRCDDDALAPSVQLSQCASKQLLVRVRSIRLGRIEKRASEFDGAMDGGDRLTGVTLFRGAVRMTHPHQAEADGGDGETLGAERSCGEHM